MPVSQPSDSDKHADYYEGIIQLRPQNKDVYEYVLNQFKKHRTAWISKEKKLKTGLDMYVSSWRVALAVGKKVKRVFGGTIVTSRSLHSTDKMTSKRRYRVSVCWRPDKQEDL